MSIYNNTLLDDAGILGLESASVVIIRTEWNNFITDELNKAAVSYLQGHQVKSEQFVVPGAVELPYACKQIWERFKGTSSQPSAIIVFGCVIQGETPHFDYVCQAVTQGITQLNIEIPIPVIFGVLTVHNEQQAHDRLGGKHGHKGTEAAITALKMIAFSRQLNR
jgi:6,7-dimethyl-8-ribityllumazine synthase